MFKRMEGNIITLLVFSLFMIGVIGAIRSPQGITQQVFSPVQATRNVLIIDAGHGGEDGGTSSPSGIRESDLNLAIAQKLDRLMAFCGVETLLLRTEDISLHDEGADTLREKKVSDLHNRADAINSYEQATVISIHQNYFEGASSSGAQVFYAREDDSMLFANETQSMLVKYLDPFNHRKAAQIPNTVYLMNHISCPAILVECGFLSNHEDVAKLNDEAYQKKLAVVLGASYLMHEGG